MITNQLMSVAFHNGQVQVFHGTSMGDLTQLWRVGNISRVMEGKTPANITKFLESSATIDFMNVVEKHTGKKPIEKTGRGKAAKTWANIHMMVYAAEYLSTEFHFEVIDKFINNKILELRDLGGEHFKALNIIVDSYLPDRVGKDNKGIYINIAKLLKNKVSPTLVSWNDADEHQLRQRDNYEQQLSSFLKNGLIKDWEHLKTVINNL